MKELVFHWYISKRNINELKEIEKFHLYEIKKFDLNKIFDDVFCVLSIDDLNNKNLVNICFAELEKIFGNKIKIEIIKNNKNDGEFYTYKNYVINRLNVENLNICYLHFKGTSNIYDKRFIFSRIYWSKNMYEYLFSKNTLDNIEKYAMTFWASIKVNNDWFNKWLWLNNKPNIGLNGQLFPAGSFQWLNTNIIDKYLSDNNINLDNINYKKLKKTHICEYLLANIINDKYKCVGIILNTISKLTSKIKLDDDEKNIINNYIKL